ncbi:MAG: BREX-1 system adenine-specific DNA-methyltransferase PglX [Lentisphaeria bacterium]|nr:BREX-1 system adenine-specific DNA-methyltransferase PglX [Lentisphaeria bacterium]
MNKTAVRNFAIWAHRELISCVSQKAVQYGISEGEVCPFSADLTDKKVLNAPPRENTRRSADNILLSGSKQTIEEVAYTWFNRFCMLRFMEVNGFLPSGRRLFSNEKGEFHPQIPDEALHIEKPSPFKEKGDGLPQKDQAEELFKHLLITQCNALNAILPGAFLKISDEAELLFPDALLGEESFTAHLVRDIPEEDWLNNVQIVGWLYQYYNTGTKDRVFADLRNNIKISKENIPAATQLFTPDWVVRYMVENSLGRIFINSKVRKSNLCEADRRKEEKAVAEKLGWQYYLPEPEQTPETRAELDSGEHLCAPETLKVIDPCMGSGHVLVCMFDLLMQIYRESGYDDRTAVAHIVSHNLYGLDIDEKAAGLAYFAVMMKARQYDPGFFQTNIHPGVYAICESNHISQESADHFCGNAPELAGDIRRLVSEMRDAKEYGSILNITPADFGSLHKHLERLRKIPGINVARAVADLTPLIQCAEVMTQMYDVVVTNPPYMGSSNMNAALNKFIKENYADFRYDFFAAFIVKCSKITKAEGFLGFFVPYVWMFIRSYEKLRRFIYDSKTIENLIQFEYSAFEEATVPVCAFTFCNKYFNKKLSCIRLVDFKGGMEIQREKTLEAINDPQCGFYFEQSVKKFAALPGVPAAFWISDRFLSVFANKPLADTASPRQGLATGCNEIFTRMWFECASKDLCLTAGSRREAKESGCKWFPYNKGGEFRKWYGNNDFVVNWKNDGEAIRNFKSENGSLRSRPQNMACYFKESITWSKISSGAIAFRYKPCGHIFDVAGTSVFAETQDLLYLLGFCNSKVTSAIAGVISPTMNYEVGHIASLPVIIDDAQKQKIIGLVEKNIALAKADWDSFETSWEFVRHPLAVVPCANAALISEKFEIWKNECEKRFAELKANEEELNRIFIEIYGLQDELSPETEDKDITLRKADAARDIRSFISYAVGCILGRYSPDTDGIICAGGNWSPEKYRTFPAAEDNIIPVCGGECFEDDLTGRFIKFVSMMYGAETLEQNLAFIARALGGSDTPEEVIRQYFSADFFADHCRIYHKRPIYWLFDSGKKGGFRALVYMHRFTAETLERMQKVYLDKVQKYYRTAVDSLTQPTTADSVSEKKQRSRELTLLKARAEETRLYGIKLRNLAEKKFSVDLDKAVKSNYALFRDVLAKIR